MNHAVVSVTAMTLMDGALAPDASPTLADLVADRIVNSGDRLIEVEMAHGLHVSRMPVREALQLLECQGIIVPLASRGSLVTTGTAHLAEVEPRGAVPRRRLSLANAGEAG